MCGAAVVRMPWEGTGKELHERGTPYLNLNPPYIKALERSFTREAGKH